jgi:hypothetical protein
MCKPTVNIQECETEQQERSQQNINSLETRRRKKKSQQGKQKNQFARLAATTQPIKHAGKHGIHEVLVALVAVRALEGHPHARILCSEFVQAAKLKLQQCAHVLLAVGIV